MIAAIPNGFMELVFSYSSVNPSIHKHYKIKQYMNTADHNYDALYKCAIIPYDAAYIMSFEFYISDQTTLHK